MVSFLETVLEASVNLLISWDLLFDDSRAYDVERVCGDARHEASRAAQHTLEQRVHFTVVVHVEVLLRLRVQ